eukprot:PhF_6_TR37552/c0_g1_i1/m.55627
MLSAFFVIWVFVYLTHIDGQTNPPSTTVKTTFRDHIGTAPVVGTVVTIPNTIPCPPTDTNNNNNSTTVYGMGIFESRSHVGCTVKAIGMSASLISVRVTVVGSIFTYVKGDQSVDYTGQKTFVNPLVADDTHYGVVFDRVETPDGAARYVPGGFDVPATRTTFQWTPFPSLQQKNGLYRIRVRQECQNGSSATLEWSIQLGGLPEQRGMIPCSDTRDGHQATALRQIGSLMELAFTRFTVTVTVTDSMGGNFGKGLIVVDFINAIPSSGGTDDFQRYPDIKGNIFLAVCPPTQYIRPRFSFHIALKGHDEGRLHGLWLRVESMNLDQRVSLLSVGKCRTATTECTLTQSDVFEYKEYAPVLNAGAALIYVQPTSPEFLQSIWYHVDYTCEPSQCSDQPVIKRNGEIYVVVRGKRSVCTQLITCGPSAAAIVLNLVQFGSTAAIVFDPEVIKISKIPGGAMPLSLMVDTKQTNGGSVQIISTTEVSLNRCEANDQQQSHYSSSCDDVMGYLGNLATPIVGTMPPAAFSPIPKNGTFHVTYQCLPTDLCDIAGPRSLDASTKTITLNTSVSYRTMGTVCEWSVVCAAGQKYLVITTGNMALEDGGKVTIGDYVFEKGKLPAWWDALPQRLSMPFDNIPMKIRFESVAYSDGVPVQLPGQFSITFGCDVASPTSAPTPAPPTTTPSPTTTFPPPTTTRAPLTTLPPETTSTPSPPKPTTVQPTTIPPHVTSSSTETPFPSPTSSPTSIAPEVHPPPTPSNNDSLSNGSISSGGGAGLLKLTNTTSGGGGERYSLVLMIGGVVGVILVLLLAVCLVRWWCGPSGHSSDNKGGKDVELKEKALGETWLNHAEDVVSDLNSRKVANTVDTDDNERHELSPTSSGKDTTQAGGPPGSGPRKLNLTLLMQDTAEAIRKGVHSTTLVTSPLSLLHMGKGAKNPLLSSGGVVPQPGTNTVPPQSSLPNGQRSGGVRSGPAVNTGKSQLPRNRRSDLL